MLTNSMAFEEAESTMEPVSLADPFGLWSPAVPGRALGWLLPVAGNCANAGDRSELARMITTRRILSIFMVLVNDITKMVARTQA
ncbi:hypothetical protein D3C87_1657370 [compost metagenome]